MAAEDAARLEDVTDRGAAVDEALAAGKLATAVAAALVNPPLNSKDAAVKSAAAAVVYKALDAVAGSKIPGVVKKLDPEAADTAMKYVYRAMAETHNCSAMLKWHAALVEHAGLACISRVIASRKTV